MGSPRLHAAILAGGRGTRFWPRSRRRTPKQLLPVFGDSSLLQQTVERLRPLIPDERIWIFTNELLRPAIEAQLPDVPRRQIVAEPEARNTAPCIAMAARLIEQADPGAVMAVFPSDHLIGEEQAYLDVISGAARAAESGEHLVVLGIEPRWAETGYGYVEFPEGTRAGGFHAIPVVQFREKPNEKTAQEFVDAGNFYWNSGQFLWRASTLTAAVEKHLPRTAEALSELAPLDSRDFPISLGELYPLCDSTSIDYGVLEKAKNIVGLACKDFGWNDVGSWEAVYQVSSKDANANVVRGALEALDASGNYVDAPGKLVALVGVEGLVVVDTEDALLVCRREDAQKVSALVKALEEAHGDALL